jgi:photosystem II stability/assembly factor-like uncharacterized protein
MTTRSNDQAPKSDAEESLAPLCQSGGKPLQSKVFVALALLLIFSTPTFAQAGTWARQRSGTVAWLHSLYFFDQNRGLAIGSKGTLLSTVDGGTTWQPKPSLTNDILRDIFFVDENNGWLVCEVNVYDLKTKTQPRAYLMHTTDGGERWQRIDIKGVDVDARLVRAIFSRGGRGWAFGEEGAIFTTRDGGNNWTRLQSPTRHLLLGGIFIDEDRGWIVGAGATIIQTSDGGETWYQSRLPQTTATPIKFAAASFVDNRLGWAVGSGGAIYRTTNGGRTWQPQISGVANDLYDVKFLDPLEGWAVGAEGTIVYTNDGGLHWVTQPSNTEHPLERVFFTDRTHGWAVGFGGTVVTYVRPQSPRLQ